MEACDLLTAVVVHHAALEEAGAHCVERLQGAACAIQVVAAFERAFAVNDFVELTHFIWRQTRGEAKLLKAAV
jgi:hypothetical protein